MQCSVQGGEKVNTCTEWGVLIGTGSCPNAGAQQGRIYITLNPCALLSCTRNARTHSVMYNFVHGKGTEDTPFYLGGVQSSARGACTRLAPLRGRGVSRSGAAKL